MMVSFNTEILSQQELSNVGLVTNTSNLQTNACSSETNNDIFTLPQLDDCFKSDNSLSHQEMSRILHSRFLPSLDAYQPSTENFNILHHNSQFFYKKKT